MVAGKVDLKGMSMAEITSVLTSLGEKSYRAGQLMRWIYRKGATSFSEMTDLSESLRKRLKDFCYISRLEPADVLRSKEDGTLKFLFRLRDGLAVESVLIGTNERKVRTACISTQVGCNVRCSFCATGLRGFARNLTEAEIVDQIIQMKRLFPEYTISNIVIMGMGEPLLNMRAVLSAIEIMNLEDALGIGMRRITLSTAGVVPEIYELAKRKLQLTLAISLHAPTNELRSKLVPINRAYPLVDLMKAAEYYVQTTGRRVSFEYVLLRDVNDSAGLAYKLAGLLKGMKAHLNLIEYNEVPGAEYRPSTQGALNRFKKVIEDSGIEVTIRKSRGRDISAACGQLARINQ